MKCTLEPALQSGDTGQQIPFWQLSIDNNMDVQKDVHLWVKHRLYMPWTLGVNAQLQENSQSEHTFYFYYIIINIIKNWIIG